MTTATSADKLTEQLAEYIREALELRLFAALPTVGAEVTNSYGVLLDVRHRLDKIEELLSRVIRIRAKATRAANVSAAIVDDAWDAAVHKTRSSPVQRGDDYSSARERHAEANLAVLDLRREARAAQALKHTCDEAVEVIRLAYHGLDGLRHDLLIMLRTLQFESHLER